LGVGLRRTVCRSKVPVPPPCVEGPVPSVLPGKIRGSGKLPVRFGPRGPKVGPVRPNQGGFPQRVVVLKAPRSLKRSGPNENLPETPVVVREVSVGPKNRQKLRRAKRSFPRGSSRASCVPWFVGSSQE